MSIYAQSIITHETLVSANSVYFTSFHVLKPNRRRNKLLVSASDRVFSSDGELVLPMRCNDGFRGSYLRSSNRVRVYFSNGWSSGIDTESIEFVKKKERCGPHLFAESKRRFIC